MTDTVAKKPTLINIGPCRFSYAKVFKAEAVEEGGTLKYSVCLLIPKKNTAHVAAINAAIEAAKKDGKDSKWKGKIPINLKMPMRDGDVERPEDPSYEGMWFINATSNNKPQIIDASGEFIVNPEQFYSGCWGRANVNFYPFDADGKNKGIACGLNHLQKLKDGTPLSGVGGSAADAFNDGFNVEEVEIEEEEYDPLA
jgi:hypothetical protein